MGNRSDRGGFDASPEQKALWPQGVSGNTINGLGETQARRPSPIYWHPEGCSPFYPLQEWMMSLGVREPKVAERRSSRTKVIEKTPCPIAEQRFLRSPEENVRNVKEAAYSAGAELVGVVATQPDWIFEGYDFDYPWIVMIGVSMDFEKLSTAPKADAAVAVVDGYTRGWEVAQPLADHIRALGWRAEPRGGPPAGPINLVPAALSCGFGELGKHGSIISRSLGSNFRLAAVFTDLPLIEDKSVDIAAEDFCLNCQVCTNACPVEAISNEKQLVRGVEKWYVDFDRCLPYFNENYGCAICIAVCPWSYPGRGPVISDKMFKRRANSERLADAAGHD